MSENEEAPNAKEYYAIASTIPTPEEPTLTKYYILAMKMKELNAELKKRNLNISGNKQTLQFRLQEAVKNNVPVGPPISASVPVIKEEKVKKISTGFPPGAYWKVLYHESVQVVDPSNPTFKAPRAPTVHEEYEMEVPTKYNFTETFDRTVWQGRMDKSVLFSSWIRKK